jgi:hypothetical protein
MNRKFLLRSSIVVLAACALSSAGWAQDKKPAKPEAKTQPKTQPKTQAKSDPTEQAVLLGQFGDWGAYKAAPGGKRVCFALAKPSSATTEPAGRKRDPSYAFISTRPAEKVRNEVSVIVGYPQKAGVDASATIGSASYVMYTQNDGAWVKNAAEEAQMVETMRKGGNLVIKSESGHGTKTTDTYSLKGIGEAIDKAAEECK